MSLKIFLLIALWIIVIVMGAYVTYAFRISKTKKNNIILTVLICAVLLAAMTYFFLVVI